MLKAALNYSGAIKRQELLEFNGLRLSRPKRVLFSFPPPIFCDARNSDVDQTRFNEITPLLIMNGMAE